MALYHHTNTSKCTFNFAYFNLLNCLRIINKLELYIFTLNLSIVNVLLSTINKNKFKLNFILYFRCILYNYFS